MVPVWLFEVDVFGRSMEPMKVEARQQGMGWGLVQPRPFLAGQAPDVSGIRLTDQDCVIFSGTFPLMRHIQLHRKWSPGGWCTAENLDCRAYYPAFGQHLLNHANVVLSMDDALAGAGGLFARFGREGRVFARPVGVQKTFTGRCMEPDDFSRALESSRYTREPVLIASPREVEREWRVVVARGRFVAASQYMQEGRYAESPGCPREVRDYVGRILAEVPYRPDPIYTMDICVSEGGLHVLELNSFSCSGLYQCDAAAVVAEVKALAVEAWRQAKGP